MPDVQAKLDEVKIDLAKLDELLAEECSAHTKAEEEYVSLCSHRAKELEQLKKQLIDDEQRQTELSVCYVLVTLLDDNYVNFYSLCNRFNPIWIAA